MKTIDGIGNALLLTPEEARELMRNEEMFVLLDGFIEKQYAQEPRPVLGSELWRVGEMCGMSLCVTSETAQALITSSPSNFKARAGGTRFFKNNQLTR